MNSDIVQKELNKIEADKKLAMMAIDADKEVFAQQLRKGLGEEIKRDIHLVNNPKPIKKSKKMKAKTIFARLTSIFSDPKIDEDTVDLLPDSTYHS